MRILLIVMLGIFFLFEAVHAMPESDNQKKMGTVHGVNGSLLPTEEGKAAVTGMISVIQNATLPGYKNMKIGDALQKYQFFNKKEWHETRASNGKVYVDFIGYFPSRWFDMSAIKTKIAARGIEVKFLIYPDGQYGVAMVSKVEIDSGGTMQKYPLEDVIPFLIH